MSLPNIGMDFTAFDILPAASLDDLVENIEALAAGTAFDSASSITSLSLSNPYKFSAKQTTTHAIGTADTRVQFDTEDFDTGSNFDSTGTKGTFTAPVAGFYQFNVFVSVAFAGSITSSYLTAYKNGSAFRRLAYIQVANATTGLPGAIAMKLLANDTVDMRVGTTGAATNTVSTAENTSTFSGFLISRI